MNSFNGMHSNGLKRKLLHGQFMLGVALGLLLAFGSGSARAATQPIEGTWNLGNGQVLVQAQPDGSFSGFVVEPITFARCIHPVGQVIWTIQGSGLSYTGTHVWFHPHCSFEPGGQSTWQINDTSAAEFTLTFCTAHPGDGPPDPTGSPGHNVGTTQCFDLTRALAPGQTPAAPGNTTSPSISGTPAAGDTLTCSPGAWTNNPTAFDYSWSVGGTPIVGATRSTYKVTTADEGLSITCTVVAFNGGGAGTAATSETVIVKVPVIKGCPRATGRASGTTLGLARLGMTRAQVRHSYTKSSERGRKYEDFFCLTPIGVRVGYASPLLLKVVPKQARAALKGRVVWASTANAYYTIKGIRAGARLAAAKKKLDVGKPLHIGPNYWYLAPDGKSTAVLKVRHGIVDEIGIVDKALTDGRTAQSALMHSFY
jgi:hypothetical protein